MITSWLLAHESALRSALFFGLLAALALLERLVPCRGDARLARRQIVNLSIIAIDTALIRAVFPLLGIAFAMRMHDAGIGLFALLHWPESLEIGLAVMALDLAIYFQHRLLHVVPWLWRAHRMHHSDTAFDVTLGVRFHPFEIAISQLIKFAAIAALGAAPLAVLMFELLLLGGSLFTHTDIALPSRLDRALRWLIVTPNMHRVHHSISKDETDSNFGFNLAWWDRLFGTYRATSRTAENTMTLGLQDFRDPAEQGLVALLAQPFRATIKPTPAAPETPMRDTWPQLRESDFPVVQRAALTTLQINLGYLCNISCIHCHVNAGPRRTELMDRATMELALDFADRRGIATLDVTGGSPEMNPHFRWFIESARAQGMHVMDRCNPTIIEEPGYEWVAGFLATQKIEVIASLPCYSEGNVDEQRGSGVFESSIRALQRLNALGYGKPDTGLTLNLVYNPNGAFLPPAQDKLELDYKRMLGERHGIVFNHLFTITNMPIKRFGSWLVSKGKFDEYMEVLRNAHRPQE